MVVVIGDFDSKSSNWYTGDTTNFQGCKIETRTSQFDIQQIVEKPSHILGKSVSWIDLILTSQPSLVMNLGIHIFLHQNCHHEIVFANFNLKVHYPPSYEHEVLWHFKKANTDHTKRVIKGFPGKRLFPF